MKFIERLEALIKQSGLPKKRLPSKPELPAPIFIIFSMAKCLKPNFRHWLSCRQFYRCILLICFGLISRVLSWIIIYPKTCQAWGRSLCQICLFRIIHWCTRIKCLKKYGDCKTLANVFGETYFGCARTLPKRWMGYSSGWNPNKRVLRFRKPCQARRLICLSCSRRPNCHAMANKPSSKDECQCTKYF